MNFIVESRECIEQGILVRSSYVVISIRDPDKRKVRIPKQSGLRDVLRLAFHDAEPAEGTAMPDGIKLMTPEQAEQVWRFALTSASQVGTIVVHCEQGMSRSPAVAAALCKCLGGDEWKFFREYQPNLYVYGLVLAAATRQQR